jgi:photosystem I subunit XII
MTLTARSFEMSLSDTQVFIALVVALIPGVLAFRLATELYK